MWTCRPTLLMNIDLFAIGKTTLKIIYLPKFLWAIAYKSIPWCFFSLHNWFFCPTSGATGYIVILGASCRSWFCYSLQKHVHLRLLGGPLFTGKIWSEKVGFLPPPAHNKSGKGSFSMILRQEANPNFGLFWSPAHGGLVVVFYRTGGSKYV